MKQLNITYDDKDFNELKKKKGHMNWHDFILLLKNWEDEPVLKVGDN